FARRRRTAETEAYTTSFDQARQFLARREVCAVAFLVAGGLAGNGEDLAPGHQLAGLVERGGIRLGLGGPAAAGEAVVGVRAERLAAGGAEFGQRGGPGDVRGGPAVA